jgi:TrmH family RNA methyltransferase
MILEINSLSNPKIKEITKLSKDGQLRQEKNIIIVDGQREIAEAIKNKWKIEEFFCCLDFIEKKDKINNNIEVEKIIKLANKSYKLSTKAFDKISYKKNPDGFLAVLKTKKINLNDIKLKKNPLILVLESVEKPGNLGGIIRTAYASGVDLIILNDQKTDIFSPNVIRSSTGFIFSIPLVITSIEDTYDWLIKNKIQILSTSIKAKQNHFSTDFKKASALIFGTEADGLTNKWLEKKTTAIKIPMIPGVDSLNVSVSVGIIIYEAMRQRLKFK